MFTGKKIERKKKKKESIINYAYWHEQNSELLQQFGDLGRTGTIQNTRGSPAPGGLEAHNFHEIHRTQRHRTAAEEGDQVELKSWAA